MGTEAQEPYSPALSDDNTRRLRPQAGRDCSFTYVLPDVEGPDFALSQGASYEEKADSSSVRTLCTLQSGMSAALPAWGTQSNVLCRVSLHSPLKWA